MVEMLLALPVVLLLALGIVQFTLVYQARHALDHALTQAARQGAVQHASAEAIERGLASGLVPFLRGADDWPGLLQAEAGALEHVRDGVAAGWILLRQRSPTRESFDDWSEPALDPMGEPIAGIDEIANDNLDSRRLRMQPASGVVGRHGAEAIGRLSGQTLADANVLRLELVYGLRLVVPLVGPIVVRMLARWNGCSGVPAPSPGRLGLLRLHEDSVVAAGREAVAWMCRFLLLRDEAGRAAGRIPIRASATIRMMSPARRSPLTQARVDIASGRRSPLVVAPPPADPGGVSDRWNEAAGMIDFTSPPAEASGPASGDLVLPLDNGFLAIGSDRPYPQPATHPALCDG